MKYVLTHTITIPSGTILEADNRLGEGGCSVQAEDDVLGQFFIGITRGLAEGTIVPKREVAGFRLALVEDI